MPTRLVDRARLLQGRRYPEARDLRWTAEQQYGCCSSSIITYYLPQQTIFECTRTAALNSMRDGPVGHGFGQSEGLYISTVYHLRSRFYSFQTLRLNGPFRIIRIFTSMYTMNLRNFDVLSQFVTTYFCVSIINNRLKSHRKDTGCTDVVG